MRVFIIFISVFLGILFYSTPPHPQTPISPLTTLPPPSPLAPASTAPTPAPPPHTTNADCNTHPQSNLARLQAPLCASRCQARSTRPRPRLGSARGASGRIAGAGGALRRQKGKRAGGRGRCWGKRRRVQSAGAWGGVRGRGCGFGWRGRGFCEGG